MEGPKSPNVAWEPQVAHPYGRGKTGLYSGSSYEIQVLTVPVNIRK